ncbi:MAG: alcohol dehydrogenase catalytic domain-containing protein [Clostridiales bacterium]|jgi:threonine dehydrogenase-like Zn-dependent dehydrogenase|nr:alcohol dehydrogenase catalytic domain-containing protein [Clostridiales bacterium]
MKAAVLVGPSKFDITDVPMPVISDNEVLLKVRACGICGSDWRIYLQGPSFANMKKMILGHEFTGEIVEIGRNVSGWELGARVIVDPYIHCFNCAYCKQHQYNRCMVYNCVGITVDGAYAEYVKVYPYQMVPISNKISDAEGTLFQPIACGLNVARLGKCTIGDTVVVSGAGTIGLTTMIWAKAMNVHRLIATEVSEARINCIKENGLADMILNPTKDNIVGEITKATGGIGADAALECSGNRKAQVQTVDYVRKGGIIVAFGTPYDDAPTEVNWSKLSAKDLTVRGGLSAGSHPGGYEFSVKAVE